MYFVQINRKLHPTNNRVVMFKKSNKSPQGNVFGDIVTFLSPNTKSSEAFSLGNKWHNQFREHIYYQIDESPYSALYTDKMGSPNAPISLLVSMMILKELFKMSDATLYEALQYNLQFRAAVNLFDISTPLPAESTYYLFRHRLDAYSKSPEGSNLFEETFKDITQKQAMTFSVSGKTLRMDSTLVGSNIAWYTRYELAHETLRLYWRILHKSNELSRMGEVQFIELSELMSKEGKSVVYHHDRDELKVRHRNLGKLIYYVLTVYKGDTRKEYALLDRLFREQYTVRKDKENPADSDPSPSEEEDVKSEIELKASDEILSSSLQSPHDAEAAYENKRGKKVKGYAANITETCEKNQLNLVTSSELVPANIGDAPLLMGAIDKSIEVMGTNPEKVHIDGGYYREANVKACKALGIDPVFTGVKGFLPRYDLEWKNEQLIVTDKHSGLTYQALKVRPNKRSKGLRYFIIVDSKRKYFDEPAILTSEQRRKMGQRSQEELNVRNNVEATIYQVVHDLRNGKTRYRGIFRNTLWLLSRVLSINIRRITKYVNKVAEEVVTSHSCVRTA